MEKAAQPLAAEGKAGQQGHFEETVRVVGVFLCPGTDAAETVVLLQEGDLGLQGEPVVEGIADGQGDRETAPGRILAGVIEGAEPGQPVIGVAALDADVPLGGGLGCAEQKQQAGQQPASDVGHAHVNRVFSGSKDTKSVRRTVGEPSICQRAGDAGRRIFITFATRKPNTGL